MYNSSKTFTSSHFSARFVLAYGSGGPRGSGKQTITALNLSLTTHHLLFTPLSHIILSIMPPLRICTQNQFSLSRFGQFVQTRSKSGKNVRPLVNSESADFVGESGDGNKEEDQSTALTFAQMEVRCYYCGKKGHKSPNCTHPRTKYHENNGLSTNHNLPKQPIRTKKRPQPLKVP